VAGTGEELSPPPRCCCCCFAELLILTPPTPSDLNVPPPQLAKLSEVSPAIAKARRGVRQRLVYFFGSYD
jgi:hypothetical protein